MPTDEDNQSVITPPGAIEFFYQKPDALPHGFMDEICKLVEAGGSVNPHFVRFNLERAYLIGYALANNVIVGNSCLKHPRPEFIQRLKQITGLDFHQFLERGYTSVRPEYRGMGIGTKLLEGLTQRARNHKIFSIIAEDNLATQKIALRNKTQKIAVFYSEKKGKNLGVWMPESMI